MVSEAGRSLLHASRCLYFSYDSSHQLLSGEYATDLTQEQVFALQIPIKQFPVVSQAMETMQFVVGEKEAVPAALAARLRPILGDERFVVVPLWVVGHLLGFLVFSHVKVQAEKITSPLSLSDLGQAGSSLLAVLGYRLELIGAEDDEPAQVGIIQRYAAMGQMAAEIGHDIQASLYGMKNYAYLLSKGVTDSRKLNYTRAITEGIAYIEKLSAEMRKLSGEPRTVTLGPTDLCKVIDSAVLLMNPLAIERGITIIKELADGIPILNADPNALTEVFLNLGINAIHSMSDGGQIRITVKPEGDRVAITFQDNGCGISEEALEKFWNNSSYAAKSFTNKGLYIVQRIVRQLKGSIEVDTKPGVGTTFFIELWVNPAVSAPKTDAGKRIPPSYQPSPVGEARSALT
jgi:signal transduction histidine kinase